MDSKEIPIESFNNILLKSFEFLGLILLVVIIARVVFNVKSDFFNRGLSVVKFLGYLLLACGAYFVTYSDGRLHAGMPEALSISQCFVVVLSIFEALSNFVAIWKYPKNDG
ncbi:MULTISPECIES: hypothetical protein [Paenibacillus]|uniref:hypothetical protein n=1 Tax=Paenibacillus TaxID=44249 RepID=UPI0009A67ADE|nr:MULTISPECIES: hypothetical protein [Paenibacillus]MCZ1269463.1 hypothetical protein [Paenibacillus tundrae]SLK16289.1 hypothetical protein SAMN06272722_110122 [Paenibacillus sp. RU5A]SOC74300.1 hypothetical protein SAMN05880581_110122 [Paenibacillus sp. RU26A]SOC76445.1 hypothetical protein SAMN05880586_110122 [Paenibacillus sp. RU5M]